jgi:hypothetical protein
MGHKIVTFFARLIPFVTAGRRSGKLAIDLREKGDRLVVFL